MVSASSATELNRVIQSNNPFDGHFVVKSQQVWGQDFPDVPSLNAHASDLVLETAQHIKKGQLNTRGIAILAPRGVGKTHILGRIRHRLQASGDGLFIYMSEYGDLSKVKSYFLQSLIASLKKIGSREVMQCQELATALIAEAFHKNYVPKAIVGQFLDTLEKRPKLVDRLLNKVIQLPLEIDNPYVLRALIWTLSPAHALYALNWLAGRELSETQSHVMGLPATSSEDKEAEAFPVALQLLNLIGRYSVPVVCFDELDGSEVGDEDDLSISGFTRAMVVVSLAKDIYNNLKKGVLVTSMYPRTYKEEIRGAEGTNDAVLDRVAELEVELKYPGSEEVVELVANWLRGFYDSFNITPPHRVYPFDEAELQRIGRDKPTIRRVLKWCADEFGPCVDEHEKIKRLYHELQQGIEDFSDDNEKISKALIFAFKHLKDQTLEGVTITTVDPEVAPKSQNNGYIQLRVIGEDGGKPTRIGVSVLQNSHGRSVGAGMRRLVDYGTFELTRGCLIRTKEIKDHWSAYSLKEQLIHELGGEWAKFEDRDVISLMALRQIASDLEDYDFSPETFHQFVVEQVSDNTLIREILSDPSGQNPEALVDEDAEVLTLPSSAGDSDDEALEDLFGGETTSESTASLT